MVSIRPATMDDLLAMQRCNLLCLPENYQLKVRGGGGTTSDGCVGCRPRAPIPAPICAGSC